MPWGRCDDGFYRHEKVAHLDPDMELAAVGLFWKSISWCNDRLTDGSVPMNAVRLLGGSVDLADELVRVGLWERAGKGYQVHDFDHFNKTRAVVMAERAQRIEAGKAGAMARWHGGSPSASPTDPLSEPANDVLGETDGGSDAPVPRTPLLRNQNPAPDARAADPFDAPEMPALQWLVAHKVVLQPHDGYYRHLVMAVERHGVAAVVQVFDELHGAGMPDGDIKGYVFGARDELDRRKRPNLRAVEKAEDRAADSERRAGRFEATKARAHEIGYHADEPDPGCPKCREGAA
jgi:hypothetical protein